MTPPYVDIRVSVRAERDDGTFEYEWKGVAIENLIAQAILDRFEEVGDPEATYPRLSDRHAIARRVTRALAGVLTDD